jgi:hypothetical protein
MHLLGIDTPGQEACPTRLPPIWDDRSKLPRADPAFLDISAVLCVKPCSPLLIVIFDAYHPPIMPIVLESESP